MKIYSTDEKTVLEAAEYLKIIGISFIPLAINTASVTMFRCMDDAKKPLYVSLLTAFINTVVNYFLIFGKAGFPRLGIKGAAIASTISTCVSMFITILMLTVLLKENYNLKLQ